jgi:large subunit ribosomal protein L25
MKSIASMEVITLDVNTRETGRKGTKALRKDDMVPCVLYGHGIKPMHFGVASMSLWPLVFTHLAHRVTIALDGKNWDCILKNVDFDPMTDVPRHADFQVLIEGEKVRLTVPIIFAGTPAGKEEGGVTEMILTELDVICLPKDMRSNVEIDISDLGIGDSIHVSDLEFEGLEIQSPGNQTVVAVFGQAPEEEEVEEEVEELEGEEEGEGEGDAEEAAEEE